MQRPWIRLTRNLKHFIGSFSMERSVSRLLCRSTKGCVILTIGVRSPISQPRHLWLLKPVNIYVNTANRGLLPLIQYQLLNRRSLCLKNFSDVYCIREMLCILNLLGFKCFEMFVPLGKYNTSMHSRPNFVMCKILVVLVIWFLV